MFHEFKNKDSCTSLSLEQPLIKGGKKKELALSFDSVSLNALNSSQHTIS